MIYSCALFCYDIIPSFESKTACLTMPRNFSKIFSYYMLPAKKVLQQKAKSKLIQ